MPRLCNLRQAARPSDADPRSVVPHAAGLSGIADLITCLFIRVFLSMCIQMSVRMFGSVCLYILLVFIYQYLFVSYFSLSLPVCLHPPVLLPVSLFFFFSCMYGMSFCRVVCLYLSVGRSVTLFTYHQCHLCHHYNHTDLHPHHIHLFLSFLPHRTIIKYFNEMH